MDTADFCSCQENILRLFTPEKISYFLLGGEVKPLPVGEKNITVTVCAKTANKGRTDKPLSPRDVYGCLFVHSLN